MVKESPPARRSPCPAAGGHTHAGTHTLPGITGRVIEPHCRRNRAGVSPGPLPGIRAKKDQSANRTPPLLLNVLLSQSDSSLWGMCPFCRGGSMVEPQARAQSWSQRWPSGSSYSIGRAQVRSPVVWPPRVMRRGLVKVPLWGHEQQGGRRGPHD